ncbi:hypothetical protein D3C75_815760 [compost metagenome]
MLVKRVNRQRIPAAVEETHAGVTGPGLTAGHRQQSRQVLYPGQAGIPVFLVGLRVKTHR